MKPELMKSPMTGRCYLVLSKRADGSALKKIDLSELLDEAGMALVSQEELKQKDALLDMVSVYEVGTLTGLPKQNDPRVITVEKREQRDGSIKWAVKTFGYVLNLNATGKGEDWEYEPQPSSRDDEFLQRTRFNSLDEAFAALERMAADDGGTVGK